MKKRRVIIGIIFLAFFVWYANLPDYRACESASSSSDGYREVTLKIEVYKAFNNQYLYQEIADNHNQINGTPDKLILKLHAFSREYRTVVFDYTDDLEYIYMGSAYKKGVTNMATP